MVLEISVTAEEKSLTVEDCHLVTAPILPFKVSEVLLVPEQTEVAPEIEPATDVGLTVIVTDGDVAEPQLPFVTKAL